MKRIELISIGVLILIFMYVVFLAFQKSLPLPNIHPVTTPTPVPNSFTLPNKPPSLPPAQSFDPSATQVTISGVTMNNFSTTATAIDSQGDLSLISSSSAYTITYFVHFNQFLLSVTGSPFDTYRQQAEETFLQQLGISPESACLLDVVITTPRYANPDQAGHTYPLSFCQK